MPIERGKRNVLTSSTSTISRMGVVSPSIPQVGEFANMVSKSISNIAEIQAKAIDSEYLTNFDINTTRFVSEKTNAILNSQEEPDVAKYQAEMESYFAGIEKDAPQRLKNQIQQKFYNQYLNGVEHIKNHANNVKYNKAEENYNLWKSSTFDYLSNEVNNIIKTRDKSEWFDTLEKLFSKDVTPDLFKGSALYGNIIGLSKGKLNEGDGEKENKQFLADVESFRVNSILKMLALSDPDNFEEIGSRFLFEYKTNTNNRRAVDYDVYGDLSEVVVDTVVTNAKNELATLVNLNKDSQASAIAANKIQLGKLYNKTSGDLKNMTNSFVLLNSDNELMNAEEISSVYGFSSEKSIKLEELNKAKLDIIGMLREAKTTDLPLANLLDNSSYEDSIKLMGGKDEVIRQYFEIDLGLPDDIETYQSDINDINLQTTLNEVYKNQVAPPGYIAFLESRTNEPFIKESKLSDVKDALFSSYRTWNVATDGGTVEISNIPAEINSMMQDIKIQSDRGLSFDKIAANIQQEFQLTPVEKTQKTKKTNSYLEQNPIDVGDVIYNYYQSQSDNFHKAVLENRELLGTEKFPVDGFAPMLGESWYQIFGNVFFEGIGTGVGFDPLTLVHKGLNVIKSASIADEFEDDFRKYYETAFRNSVSFNDDDSSLAMKSEAAAFEAMNAMAADGYGFTKFMSPDGEISLQKYSIENVTSMDSRHLQNTAAGYILGQIIQYENAGEIEQLKNYGFVDFDGEYVRPTSEEVIEMLQDGKFYFTWNGVQPQSVNGQTKASNVRYDLFYNNYEDLQGRSSNITSDPQFQFNNSDYFNPNYYSSDIDIDSVKEQMINDAVNLLPEDATIRRYITEKSTAIVANVWDIATKLLPDERKNVFDKNVVNTIAQLEADLDFKAGKELRNMFSYYPYETTGDKLNLFDNYYRNVNIATSGNVAPIPFDVDKATAIIEEIDNTFVDLKGFEKTIIGEVLYTNPEIDKSQLFKAIKNRNYKKITKLIGEKKGELIKGMLYTPDVLK